MTTKRTKPTSTTDRIVATGLAVGTAVGVTALLAIQVQSGNEANAQASASTAQTQADLDATANQLASERSQLDQYKAQLDTYHTQLDAAAAKIAQQSQTLASNTAGKTRSTLPTVTTPAPVPAPVIVKAKPAPKPQAVTRGS